jgi:hypothetical protein
MAGALLDHLVRPQQQGLRDRQAQRLGGLEVNDQLELGRLLDGEVGGLGTLEDSVRRTSRRAKRVRSTAKLCAASDQGTFFDIPHSRSIVADDVERIDPATYLESLLVKSIHDGLAFLQTRRARDPNMRNEG